MRIEEMRSGSSHLKKKADGEDHETYVALTNAGEALRLVEKTAETGPPCELAEPIWSVVSFDQLEAGGLTYEQAVNLMDELDANDINGLCIVTDSAADRLDD